YRFYDGFHTLRFTSDAHHIARTQLSRWNIGQDAIDRDVFVVHQLTSSPSRRSNPHSVHGVVQSGFQQLDQDFTGYTPCTFRFVEQVPILALQYSVGIFCLLFLHQLQSIIRLLTSSLIGAMVSRGILSSFVELIISEDRLAKCS